MYTTRHFRSVAAMLLEFRDRFGDSSEGAQHYGFLVGRFSTAFRNSNPKFNKELFEKACGWTDFVDTRYAQMMEAERAREFTT